MRLVEQEVGSHKGKEGMCRALGYSSRCTILSLYTLLPLASTPDLQLSPFPPLLYAPLSEIHPNFSFPSTRF